MNGSLSTIAIHATSEQDTLQAGQLLASVCNAGTICRLTGNLGAGKTVFAAGFAQGLGISETITSPTYPIIQEYEADIPLIHMDLYRLSGEDDVLDIGGEELFDSADSICLVEWPDRAGDLLSSPTNDIHIIVNSDGSRTINITASKTVLDSLSTRLESSELKWSGV